MSKLTIFWLYTFISLYEVQGGAGRGLALQRQDKDHTLLTDIFPKESLCHVNVKNVTQG